MKILILGGDGMLGHQLAGSLSRRFDVHVTFRGVDSEHRDTSKHVPGTHHFEVDARDAGAIEAAVGSCRPDVMINAIGVIKQRSSSTDAIQSIEINSLLPHRLSMLAAGCGARFITVSTDCVFSGRRGMYTEEDVPDATDLYGRSKLLGEIYDDGGLTLRTSIIGLELKHKRSLVEWFLGQQGSINGYSKAVYSGLTTLEFARVIEKCIRSGRELKGLYHVSSRPISKYDLLCGLRDRLGTSIEIAKDERFVSDKSLDSTRFRDALEYSPPTWDEMLDELAEQIKMRDV